MNVSRRHTLPERRELESKFRYEILFLQSMGSLFFRDGRIAENEEANTRWLRQVLEIMERMRLLLGDYRGVAAEEDGIYQQYSPFLNASTYDTKLIEFDLDEELPEPTKQISLSVKALRWFGIKVGQRVDENLDAWKWALVEKRKFEKVLAGLQEENRRLKDILPLMSLRPGSSVAIADEAGPSDPNLTKASERLGLAAHLRLKEIVASEDSCEDVPILQESLRPVTDSETGPLMVYEHHTKRSRQRILVEHKNYQNVHELTEEEVRIDRRRSHQLASLLLSAGASDLSTLSFRGLIEDPEHERNIFTFYFPPQTDTTSRPVTLFELIQSKKIDTRLDLLQRFKVAARLAKSIAAFHSDGWVHKSLRSESVVFFREASSKTLLVDLPYLVNFEYSRPQAAHTKLDYDDDYNRNLYRHPDRQGEPRISFNKLHDIYALGVVLLEIGLWQTVPEMVKEVKFRSGGQGSVQSILKQLTKRRLSHHMGPSYVEAVLSCIDNRFELRVADPDFPMIFHDEVISKIDIRALLGMGP